jgi:N-acetylneuraminic acid mutarotase
MKTFSEEAGVENLGNYVRHVFGLVVILLGVTGGFGFADTPVLTLNSTRYCVENSWNLRVKNAAPNAAIRLIGASNDRAWEIPHWANTDANGAFSASGTFAADAVGLHTVRVEITGSMSEILSLEVVNCGWKKTAPLNTARTGHKTTLLAGGNILVTGGDDVSDSAELYDAVTETWSTTGKLNTARWGYTATRLPHGKILVAGGYSAPPARTLNSAELYDPETGTWSLTGNLSAGRYSHTATLLPNGQVLVAGGIGANGYPITAELYDPETGTWRMTGSLPFWGAFDQTATLLPNGKVLLAGGSGSNDDYYALSSAMLYDPSTETWRATGNLNTPRLGHTATVLRSGKVLVAGGTTLKSPGVKLNAELYDPATETWSFTAILDVPRDGHQATLLPNGKVLVVGGILNWSSLVNMTNKADLYDPDTRTWSDAAPLNTARTSHTATLLPNGRVLVVGGAGIDAHPLKSTELYDAGFETPLLTLNSTSYCMGDPWELTVTHAEREASVRLMGASNGASWEIARWGVTGADGNFSANGTIGGGTEGNHTLRVEISGVWSKTFSFSVSNCKP